MIHDGGIDDTPEGAATTYTVRCVQTDDDPVHRWFVGLQVGVQRLTMDPDDALRIAEALTTAAMATHELRYPKPAPPS